MRLCDATTGWIEERVAATTLVPTGMDYDATDEEWEALYEQRAYDEALGVRERELAGWIDADSVSVDEVSQERAA